MEIGIANHVMIANLSKIPDAVVSRHRAKEESGTKIEENTGDIWPNLVSRWIFRRILRRPFRGSANSTKMSRHSRFPE